MLKIRNIVIFFSLFFSFYGVEIFAKACKVQIVGGIGEICAKEGARCTTSEGKPGMCATKAGFPSTGKCVCDESNLVILSSFTIVPTKDGFSLQWKTQSEFNNAGFFVWRAVEEDDEYKGAHRVSKFIPAKGSSTEGASYSYEDTISDSQKGKIYCYGLEDINTNGVAVFHDDFIRCSSK